MIAALFWFTGMAVWAWIIFISLLASLVAVENRLLIKRHPARANSLSTNSVATPEGTSND